MSAPTTTRPSPSPARHARHARLGRQRVREQSTARLHSGFQRFVTALRQAWHAIRQAPTQAFLATLPIIVGTAALAAPCSLAFGLRVPATAGPVDGGLGAGDRTLTILLLGLPGCSLLNSGGRLVRARHRRRVAELRQADAGRAQERRVAMLEAAIGGLFGATCTVLAMSFGGAIASWALPSHGPLAMALTTAQARPLALAGIVMGSTLIAAFSVIGQRAHAGPAETLRAPLTWHGIGPAILASVLLVSYVVPTRAVVASPAVDAPALDTAAGPLRCCLTLLTLAGVAASVPYLLRRAGRRLASGGDPAVRLIAGRGIEANARRDARVLAPAAVLTAAVTAVAVLRLLRASPVAVLGMPITGVVADALTAGSIVAVIASAVALLSAAREAPDRRRRAVVLHSLGARRSTARRALVLTVAVPSGCALGLAVLSGALLALPGALRAARVGGQAALGDASPTALGVSLAFAVVILLVLPVLGAAVVGPRHRRRVGPSRFE